MMCTVKHSIFFFFGLTPPLLHRLQSICLDHLFFLDGMPYNLLASVSVHAWVAWFPSSVFFGSQRSTLLVMLYDQYTLYLQTSMTPTNASYDPLPSFPCRLCLSFIQSHPSGFHLVLLFGRVVALKDTRKLFISCSPSPCLGLSFIFFPLIHNLDAVRFKSAYSSHNK